MDDRHATARELMLAFAERTGLLDSHAAPTRYLWTDAFAVCNLLGLSEATREQQLEQLALDLVAQVHHTLGRHAAGSARRGWISGLDDPQAERHPTLGGLRIGKPLPERGPGEPFDAELEWERDGQYYHYLTQWMHALERVSRVTGRSDVHRHAVELARTAHARFSYRPTAQAPKRMYWKMSVDLGRPLVESMGQHDPIAGLVACCELQSALTPHHPELDLGPEIAQLEAMCVAGSFVTSDLLGIGGLLCDASRLLELCVEGACADQAPWIRCLFAAAGQGLATPAATAWTELPAERRLAFRELGLAIGLRAARRGAALLDRHGLPTRNGHEVSAQLEALTRHDHLAEAVAAFWLDPAQRASRSWTEHLDINEVMLATSLAPDGYLSTGSESPS